MPIQLPPLTRRGFLLQAALLAAAGCAGPQAARGQPGRKDLDSWAFLADTHIAADPASVTREVRMAGHLERVGRELGEGRRRLAGAIINGDCALLKGESGDYRTLVSLLEPVRASGVPVWCTLGNHDQREQFRAVVGGGTPEPGSPSDRQVAVLRTPRVNLFLLDSLEVTNQTPGRLGPAQLEWLAQALDRHGDKPAVVLGHHHLESGEVRSGLRDSQALLAVLEARRQVKLYVYGHTHVWKREQTPGGLHLVNLPPVAYVFEKGRPSGWVHALFVADGVRLELRTVDPSHPQQGEVAELRWRSA